MSFGRSYLQTLRQRVQNVTNNNQQNSKDASKPSTSSASKEGDLLDSLLWKDESLLNKLQHIGHLTEVPAAMTYSSVVSRDSVRIIILIAALNDLDLRMCDIGNVYQAETPDGNIHEYTANVKWETGEISWIPLKDIKESDAAEVAEYAIQEGIADEPAFAMPHYHCQSIISHRRWRNR